MQVTFTVVSVAELPLKLGRHMGSKDGFAVLYSHELSQLRCRHLGEGRMNILLLRGGGASVYVAGVVGKTDTEFAVAGFALPLFIPQPRR